MTSKAIDAYGSVTGEVGTYTELAGRYAAQRDAETLVPADVMKKLELRPSDSLLEVGCGAGNLLLPLSRSVRRSAGVDHPRLLAQISVREPQHPIELLAGDFLELEVPAEFNKVLTYSVLHCLPDHETVLRFVERVLNLLPSGGAALFGDLPNDDLKARFQASEAGRVFEDEWRTRMSDSASQASDLHVTLSARVVDLPRARFDDLAILGLVEFCRAKGYNAYWLPQEQGLPFGHTREDLLVRKP